MGLLHAWQYFDHKGIEYWILELKRRVRIGEHCDNLVFYNCTEEKWWVCNRSFPIDENCHRVTYEALRQQWQKYWDNSNAPFSLFDVVAKELAVWTYYVPLDFEQARQEKPGLLDELAKYLPRIPPDKMPQPDTEETGTRFRENVYWIFHLKQEIEIIEPATDNNTQARHHRTCWVTYCPTKKIWGAIDVHEYPVNNTTCHHVPFDVLEIEWRRMFCDDKMPNRPKFTLESIVER